MILFHSLLFSLLSEDSKSNYLPMISSPEFEIKFNKSVEVDHSDPNLLVNYVTEVLLDAAKKAKVKYRKCNSANDSPWFDKSCRELKNSVKSLGTKIHQNAKDPSLKSELYSKKKELKKLIRSNKVKFKNDILEQMKQSKSDSKKFWKLLDKLEKKKDDSVFKQGISIHRWVSHFQSIFRNSEIDHVLPKNNRENGVLDREISDEEMKLAAYILRNGKAPGFDSISNEMLQCFLEVRPEILRRFVNSILKNPRIREKWSISMINPLHKAGSKMDPDNYRGISLLSCFSKYFSAILNLRLRQYAIDNNIFSKSQLGFMAGCRTADALFFSIT